MLPSGLSTANSACTQSQCPSYELHTCSASLPVWGDVEEKRQLTCHIILRHWNTHEHESRQLTIEQWCWPQFHKAPWPHCSAMQGSVCAARGPARWQKWRISGKPAVPVCSNASVCVQEGGHLRFKTADLRPVLEGLLGKLFGIFSLEDSSENEYAMKTIMRVISFVGPEVSTSRAVLLSGTEVRSRRKGSSRLGCCSGRMLVRCKAAQHHDSALGLLCLTPRGLHARHQHCGAEVIGGCAICSRASLT